MPDTLSFHTLDVFTETPYTGNPLAVVPDADGLSTAQMQAMAREFNLPETIFVTAPRDTANTARVRIFLPNHEIPFAGHPTLGCAVLLATHRNGAGDFTDRIVLEEEAGIVPVDISRQDGRVSGTLTAPVVPFARAGSAPRKMVAAALGLTEQEVNFGPHRPSVFEGGPAYLYAPVANARALSRARPVEPAWSELVEQAGEDSVYLYTGDGRGGFRARMFSPASGVPEDPATGSAAAILAAQLLASGVVREGEQHWNLTQGVEMGRESRIGLTVRRDGEVLAEVRITGSAVPISRGEITPPPAGDA